MSLAVNGEPRVVHAVPGRVRVHLPGWSGQGKLQVEAQLRQLPGVQRAQANPLTGNLLVQFDRTQIDEQTILSEVRKIDRANLPDQAYVAELPPAVTEKSGKTVRARIAVRGLDRDPSVVKRVVEHLEKRGVRASANLLTGRVLVEFAEHEIELEDLLADLAILELPGSLGEDRPVHPLDPAPLLRGAVRTLGSAFGLGVLVTRRLLGIEEALPGAGVAAHAAGVIGIIQGLPPVRSGLYHVFGRTLTDLLFSIPGIITLTLSSSYLGLTLSGAEALRLFTEARARQLAWRLHEERVAHLPPIHPDAVLHVESGERVPLAAEVLEGTGTATGRDGLPLPVFRGVVLHSGARLYGGPFVLKVKHEASFETFTLPSRPAPPAPTLYARYLRIQAPIALAYAATVAFVKRSFSSTLAGLLLVSPRTALIGMDGADLGANARVLRAGVTIVGTRSGRTVRLPGLLLLDGARVFTERLELVSVLPLTTDIDATEVLARAAGIANAARSPWGGVFRAIKSVEARDASFDGRTATAISDGALYTLGPLEDWEVALEAARLRQSGNYLLALSRSGEKRPQALFALRPRLALGWERLTETCQQHGVELAMLSTGDQLAMHALAQRAHITLIENDDALAVISARQRDGALVAFVSDHAGAAAGFAACDLAIGFTDDRAHFPARADVLAPDLAAVAAIIEAGARRETVVRDSVGLSILSNIAGIVWGLQGVPGVGIASRAVYITALGALADGWLRLRGGRRARSTIARLTDPQPERWGRREVDEVLRVLRANANGLTEKQARERLQKVPVQRKRNTLLEALLDQLSSPLTGILAAGAVLSFLLGSPGDVAIILATITANTAVSLWQEYKADRVDEMLRQINVSQAHVLRDGQVKVLSSSDIVVGDILVLSPGVHIAADARVIGAMGLEIDEAALTGESLPVLKFVDRGSDANRIVLAGSDVTAGYGRAAVFAVGSRTRMGAVRAALTEEEKEANPLGVRLSRMLSFFLPVSAIGGATVIGAGLLWGQQLTELLATGASVALAGVPEGLPLLSRVGEAGVASRLASHRAVVRRLASIESLGRVDVACTDKTGTMTRGRLQLSVVADADEESGLGKDMLSHLRRVVLTAALASPHPDAPDAHAHPTDAAVIQGAVAIDLTEEISCKHEAELSFDPVRSFHATAAGGRLCLKGAPEVLLPRCQYVRLHGERLPLTEEQRAMLLARAQSLAERGLRVLMVAEGTVGTPLDNPYNLTALGFVGINDPLRPTVRAAVRHCQEAGVQVIMVTGDHPATARTIAQQAGLLGRKDEVLNAAEIADLQNGELDQRLAKVAVVARATPLDKLRIVESLRRQGHTVAMTGDGVNDAPALRLADVGVAMGKTGTEVARQTADVVITDDDFSTLVEGFLEGRSFWRNMRRALGLLLGGNLGELGLVVGVGLLGVTMPLTVRQILAVNVITDIFPALAVILQQPEHRNLASLQREGVSALDAPLRNDVLRRGLATALPSLGAYLLTLRNASVPQARSVAFASVVSTQLAQTLMAGRAEGHLTRPVLAAVAGSCGVLLAAFSIPPLRTFLQLAVPPPWAWALTAGGALLAVLINYLLSGRGFA